MQVDNLVEVFYQKNGQYPFNDIMANPSREFLEYMEGKTNSLLNRAKREIRPGTQTTNANPRARRSPKQVSHTGGYFATNLRAWLTTGGHLKVAPEFRIYTEGNQGLAYEAAHGQLLRALIQEAAQS